MIRPVALAAAAALAACSQEPPPPVTDAPAAATAASTTGITPASVRAMVEANGPQETIATLWNENDSAGWNVVAEGIYRGEQAWLDIVPLIQPGVENATSMLLNVSLAKALLTNPAGVLAATSTVAETCTNADADYMESAEDAAASNAAYYPAAIAAVEAVSDPALATRKATCLTALRARQAAAG